MSDGCGSGRGSPVQANKEADIHRSTPSTIIHRLQIGPGRQSPTGAGGVTAWLDPMRALYQTVAELRSICRASEMRAI